ncbi:MAG: LuxR C-terminal-related transcriptional regulator [Solirubrobacterales bacterium]
MGRDVARDVRLRVALVCAPEILRLGLERVLAHDPAVSVRAHRRLQAARDQADVAVLCDRELGDAAQACAAAAERLDAGVVLVAASPEPHVVLDCLAAGATGFLMEGDSASHLKAAAFAAAAGEYHLGPRLLTMLLDSQRSERRRAPSTHEAELRLLEMLAGGHTTQEIASALGVAPKTVRNRSALLYRRLGVRSRAEAVRVAEERGLLN